MKKQILIVLPVYNNQSGLEETLKSLIPEKELYDIFIIDDGSTPPADVSNFPELPIILNRFEVNKGLVDGLNTGLKYALEKNYKYIGRIDAGDRAINNRFTKQLKYMEENADVGILGSWLYQLNKDGSNFLEVKYPTTDKNFRRLINYKVTLCHPTALMRSTVVKKVGFYDQKYYYAEDYEYWFRALKHTKIENYPDFLLEYIREPGSIGNVRRKEQLILLIKIRLKYFAPFSIWSYLGVIRSIIILTIPRPMVKYVRKFREKLFGIKGSPHGQ